jgi:hypothetical protein
LNVTPPVEEDPFNVTDEDEQVIVCAEPAFALGKEVFVVTATDEVELQPFDGSVTVTV